MKLYEVNQAIEDIIENSVDPETGEFVADEDLMQELSMLQMERGRILEYLAKLVLNNRAAIDASKEEEKRLKERRGLLEHKNERLMGILDRECAGKKTDCGVATVCYRKTTKVHISDAETATMWLEKNGHTNCYKVIAPELSKSEIKKLLVEGKEIPGVGLVQDYSCSLR